MDKGGDEYVLLFESVEETSRREEVSEELCVEKERLSLEKPGVNVFGVQPVWVVGW